MSDHPTLDRLIQDRAALVAELRGRQSVVRDLVRGVAGQYATGLYLYGSPGTAKTHTVRTVLDEEFGGQYVYKRGHITPMGLFELLSDNRDRVIVLDDVSRIFRNETALQILLAALEHPASPGTARRVEYRRQHRVESFGFTGGLICVSNIELHETDLLMALKSRVNMLNYAPTDAQLGALMLDVAERGWPIGAPVQTIPPDQAREIAGYVINAIIRRGCHMDLRLLFDKAYPGYEQWRDRASELDWRDLVNAAMDQHLVAIRHTVAVPRSRDERLEEDRAVLREILAEYDTRPAQLEAWTRRTEMSSRAFYRRLGELDGERKCQSVTGSRDDRVSA
jgi:hypothetical protein